MACLRGWAGPNHSVVTCLVSGHVASTNVTGSSIELWGQTSKSPHVGITTGRGDPLLRLAVCLFLLDGIQELLA